MKTVYIGDNRDESAVCLIKHLIGLGCAVAYHDLGGETVAGATRFDFDPADEAALREALNGLRETLVGAVSVAPPPVFVSIEEADAAQGREAFQRGVLPAFLLTKVAGALLAEKGGGALLHLGGICCEKPTGRAFLHAAQAGAVQMLSREAALAFGGKGVHSVYVRRDDVHTASDLRYPLRRRPAPGSLNGLMTFLLSEAAYPLNGADLCADEGMTLFYGNRAEGEYVVNVREPRPLPEAEFAPAPREDRVALITGSGKGVGAGIARVFAKNGIRVCLHCNSNRALAERTLKQIREMGGEAFLYQADVRDGAQLRAMAEETARRYGGIDILVNNAALQPNHFIDEYEAESLFDVLNVNFGGYLRAARACLPYLKRSARPSIVNVSSVHGKRPTVFDVGYSMSKGAIRMFTREAALEFAPYGINVNAIDLGACLIEGKTGGFPFRVRWEAETRGGGRAVLPKDAGELALYMANARNLNGAGVRLDGGSMLT